MQHRDAEDLARTLLAAFPLVELHERTLEIYVDWLSDLDREQAAETVAVLIASSTSLPTVAEVRRGVFEATTDVPTAEQAWLSVNERGAALHPLTKDVAKTFGGVYNIRTSDEPRIVRAQFFKTYGDMRERHLRQLNTASYRHRKETDQRAQAA